MKRRRPSRSQMKRFDPPPPEPRASRAWPWVLMVIAIFVSTPIAAYVVAGRLYPYLVDAYTGHYGKIVDQPIRVATPEPMISEPIPVPGFKSPKITKTQTAASPSPEPVVRVEFSFTRCPGSVQIEQDICDDDRLIEMDREAADRLAGDRLDPRYQRYLSLRKQWCEPQPSRRNRTECLLDIGQELLDSL